MARPTNSPERRAQIVRGLREQMATQGYDGATIGSIARAAGLTPGLVHYHFASKQEVLLALVADLTDRARARIAARRARAEQAPREQLGALLDALLAMGPDALPEDVACYALVASEAIRQPEVRKVYAAWVAEGTAEVAALLDRCCRDEGRARSGLPALAAGIWAAVEGCYALAAAAHGTIPPGSAARTVRRMATGLLDSQPERPR